MVVFDPFVGTGGILIAAQHFGAVGVGSDIDVRVLKGWGVSYVNKKYDVDQKVEASSADGQADSPYRTDIFVNFESYGQRRPEILRSDNAARVYRASRKNSSSDEAKASPWADAIVTDPPYGIRAGARQSGRDNRTQGADDVEFQSHESTIKDRATYIPPTITYRGGSDGVLSDLLQLASEVLVVGGPLVFLYPVELATAHDSLCEAQRQIIEPAGFKLQSAGLQPLAAGMGRYLVTLINTGR
eukprot:Selendium_serpulae@DN2217_c0_g1_i3.p2